MDTLAIKMRPKNIDEVIGQKHLIGKNKILSNLVKNKKLFSMILYGKPPEFCSKSYFKILI